MYRLAPLRHQVLSHHPSNHVSVTAYVFLGLLSATMTGAHDECGLTFELIQHYHAGIARPLQIYPNYLSPGAKCLQPVSVIVVATLS